MVLRTLGDVLTRSGTCVSLSDESTVRTLATVLVKHHVDAVAVLSTGDERLCGIATARDVSKCIARNLDLDTTAVSLVMTPNPITLPPTETPANALSLMRQGRFRHIPVMGKDSSVIGIVDVLSLAYDAITRLQLSYASIPSRRGYDLLRAARETIEKPTLKNIIDADKLTTLHPTNSVAEACELIVTRHIAAIVVVDSNGVIDGIFTCTDVVKKVISAKKDPATVAIGDVMTMNPDCAHPDFTILECLQRMQACGFRHLPVVENRSRVVVGLVDVLQLASDTLLDINSSASTNNNVNRRNTASATTTHYNINNSNFSNNPSIANRRGLPSSQPPAATPRATGRVGFGRGLVNFFGNLFSNSYAQRDSRSDSANNSSDGRSSDLPRFNNLDSSFGSLPPMGAGTSEPRSPTRRHYGYMPTSQSGRSRHSRADVPLASFKFKDCNGDFRRIKVPMVLERGDFDRFVLDVRRRYYPSGASAAGALRIKYIDEDGDEILIAHDDDLASCFEEVSHHRGRTVLLRVESASAPTSSKLQSPVSSAPSSAMGSPRQMSVSSAPRAGEHSPMLGPTVEPPPLEEPLPERDVARPSGVYRTNSRIKLHTPSTRKASEGHQMMLDKRIEEAIVLFTEALQLDENNARAMGERGAAHLLNGDAADAEADYRAALEMVDNRKFGAKGDMTYQMCIVGLVETLIDQHRYEDAVGVAELMKPEWSNPGCIDAFRDELESAANAAAEALNAADFADAMTCFNNALRVESAFLKVSGGGQDMARKSLRLGRARCYVALEDYDMALEDYDAAAKMDGESVAAHKGRGKCLMELEQLQPALEAYEKAHGLDPADEETANAIKTIKGLLPNPLQSKKEAIAKLGALLDGMKLPVKKV